MKKTEFVSLHFLHFVVSGGHQNARLEEVEMEDQNRSVFDLRNQIVQLVQFGHVDNLVSLCKMVEDWVSRDVVMGSRQGILRNCWTDFTHKLLPFHYVEVAFPALGLLSYFHIVVVLLLFNIKLTAWEPFVEQLISVCIQNLFWSRQSWVLIHEVVFWEQNIRSTPFVLPIIRLQCGCSIPLNVKTDEKRRLVVISFTQFFQPNRHYSVLLFHVIDYFHICVFGLFTDCRCLSLRELIKSHESPFISNSDV